MELTYEGLRADLTRAISEQETTVLEMREELEAEVRRTEGACYGEPAFRQEGADCELADERLQMLYGCAEDLAERERRGVPLEHPSEATDVFVEELLEVID